MLLYLELSPEKAQNWATHESVHAAVIRGYDLLPHFGVQLIRSRASEEIEVFGVFTSTMLPDGIEDDLARKIFRDILQAPGEKMSSSDKRSLGLNKR